MLIGIPKEIKAQEYRVGMTPGGVQELVSQGHEVVVEAGAGVAIGLDDQQYQSAGATLLESADAVFEQAQMIIKVKEPQPEECRRLRADQLLFTYLHLAPDPEQTRLLVESGVAAVAYETVTDKQGGLPLLAPMSEVAGRLSVQAGAWALEASHGGRGVLLGGVPGVLPADVVVIGGGVVGTNAARMARGMGANVTMLDTNLERLRQLDEQFQGTVNTLYSTRHSIEDAISKADLVVGAVLVPGRAAPKLVSRESLALMRHASVLVDVAIDQGGCFETSRATTHNDPVFTVDGVNHYCVANMPGAVARTATFALTHATLPYAIRLAKLGVKEALLQDEHLRNGLNVVSGKVTCEAVANDLNYNYVPAAEALASY